METCKKCLGEGLIGAGDQPHLRQGKISTCLDCAGTGKESAPAADPDEAARLAEAERVAAEAAVAAGSGSAASEEQKAAEDGSEASQDGQEQAVA
jgi:DnaJ-class molecular chaperone